MKNVTVTLPDELAQKAKVFAAEQIRVYLALSVSSS